MMCSNDVCFRSCNQDLEEKFEKKTSRPTVQAGPTSSKSSALPSKDSTVDKAEGMLAATLQKLTESINRAPQQSSSVPRSSDASREAETKRHYEEQMEQVKKNAELKVYHIH